MKTKNPHFEEAEYRGAEESEHTSHKEVPRLNKQEEDNEQFQLLVKGLVDYYNPASAPEEAEIITMARVLWLKRNHRELNSDTRRLDQEMSGALGRLTKSKAIHKARKLQRTQRKNQRLALIRRPPGPQTQTHAQHSKGMLQRLEPPTDGHGFANGLSPADSQEAEECRRYDRYNALYLKQLTERKLTAEEELEMNTLGARSPRWHPARIEDHPLYESVQAWRKVAEEGKQTVLPRRK